MCIKYDLIIPMKNTHLDSLLSSIRYFVQHLQMETIVILTNIDGLDTSNIEKRFEDAGIICQVVDENSLINRERITKLIRNRTDDECALRRTGWFLQQFLKLQYASLCENDYYLVWDADTIPITKHEMFLDGHPVFDMRSAWYHQQYFKTAEKLFSHYSNPLAKEDERSYISEHMLFNKRIVKEMCIEIEKNDFVRGDIWWEKIINAVEVGELPYAGFSEFETYGMYCAYKHPGVYKKRDYESLRNSGRLFDLRELTESDIDWIKKGGYYAISFETYDMLLPIHEIFQDKDIQCKYPFNRLFRILCGQDSLISYDHDTTLWHLLQNGHSKDLFKKIIIYGIGHDSDIATQYYDNKQLIGYMDSKQSRNEYGCRHNQKSILTFKEFELLDVELVMIAARPLPSEDIFNTIKDICKNKGIAVWDISGRIYL